MMKLTDENIPLLAELGTLKEKMATGKADFADLKRCLEVADALDLRWMKPEIEALFKCGRTLNRINETFQRIKLQP